MSNTTRLVPSVSMAAIRRDHALLALLLVVAGCDDDTEARLTEPQESHDRPRAAEHPAERALSPSELAHLMLGGEHSITNSYRPNRQHAGVDFGSTGDRITAVRSPVNGEITANTSECGKVAIFDGSNTIILAHMADLTKLRTGEEVSIGDYLGKASAVVGGGCKATGPHLHIEIRVGDNPVMAGPSADNTHTTLDPLSYQYSPFPPVELTTPPSGASIDADPVEFAWQPLQGANRYRLQISASPEFTDEGCIDGCLYNEAGPTTSRVVALGPGTHYWRVRAGNSGQGGRWSPVQWFAKH